MVGSLETDHFILFEVGNEWLEKLLWNEELKVCSLVDVPIVRPPPEDRIRGLNSVDHRLGVNSEQHVRVEGL